MFNPNPLEPIPCEKCEKPSKHLVYFKTEVRDIYFCEDCVPPEGTPRMKRRGYREQGFMTQPPPPPGVLY